MNKLLIYIVSLLLLGVTAYSCWQIYDMTQTRAEIKDDISKANDILYGMLSVNEWEKDLKAIAIKEIDEFELTHEQDSIIRLTVTEVLNNLIMETDKVIQEDDDSILKFVRKHAINLFFDVEDFKKKTPELTDAIMEKITSDESKERVKKIIKIKIEELSKVTHDPKRLGGYGKYLVKHKVETRKELNEMLIAKANELETTAMYHSIGVLAIGIVFLMIIFTNRKNEDLHSPILSFCIAFGVIILLTGVASPMIEIDARLQTMKFVILGSDIEFSDQFIFYRSKSIIEIISIMMSTGKLDSKIVGGLILAFSVLLPVTKLASMVLYNISERYREWKIADWLTFNSGKWSMADVMVVAIFMSYVGFQGILDNQLTTLNRSTETMTAITTNYTSLQPGFYVFVAYVIFSILLSVFLKRNIMGDGK